jgi:hypothetical protein
VGVDPEKVEVIKKWPKPKTLKAMRRFLGLTGYYRRFIQDYGKIAAPLNRMLKKNNFTWTVAAEGAFENLKQVMIRAPMLAVPDFSKEFVVECDASGVGIGAVLHTRTTHSFFESSLARKLALVIHIRERDFSIGNGGAKVAALPPWVTLRFEVRST